MLRCDPELNTGILGDRADAVLPINNFSNQQKGGVAHAVVNGPVGLSGKIKLDFGGKTPFAKFSTYPRSEVNFVIPASGTFTVSIEPIRSSSSDVNDPKREFGIGTGIVAVQLIVGSNTVTERKLGLFEIIAHLEREDSVVNVSPFLESAPATVREHSMSHLQLKGFIRGFWGDDLFIPAAGGRSVGIVDIHSTGESAFKFNIINSTAKYQVRSMGFESQPDAGSNGEIQSANHNIPIITHVGIKGRAELRTYPAYWQSTVGSTISNASLEYHQVFTGNSYLVSEDDGLLDKTATPGTIMASAVGTLVCKTINGHPICQFLGSLFTSCTQTAVEAWCFDTPPQGGNVKYAVEGSWLNIDNDGEPYIVPADTYVLDGFDYVAEEQGVVSHNLASFAENSGEQRLCIDVEVNNGIGAGDIVVGGSNRSSVQLIINATASSIRCEDNPSGPYGGDNPDSEAVISIAAGEAIVGVRDLMTP